MLEVILDTETTGLSIAENHRIVEIGCLELENLIPTNNVFHEYLNPEREISKEAFKVTWTSRKDVAIGSLMVFVLATIAAIFFLFLDQIYRFLLDIILTVNF